MPPKPEATPAPAPAPAPASPAPAAPSKFAAILPVVLVIVLAPAVSWAVAQYLILPQLEKKLGPVSGNDGIVVAHSDDLSQAAANAGDKGGKKSEAGNTYEFTNIVVNLAGTMGTRYLKTSFLVTSKDASLRETFIREKPKLVDVTINVLSSLTLADLEEAGAKNIIREKLVQAYNQALGKQVADQIYFSDFVVQ